MRVDDHNDDDYCGNHSEDRSLKSLFLETPCMIVMISQLYIYDELISHLCNSMLQIFFRTKL